MEKYPCTCGGENPNCCKCDGTGLVGRPPPPLHPPGRLRASPAPSNSKSVSVPLPANAHTTANCREGTGLALPSAKSQIACRLCGVSFSNADELLDHLNAKYPHLSISWPVRKTPVAPKEKASRPLVSCPQCGIPVGNVDKHYKRVHSPEALKLKQTRTDHKACREPKVTPHLSKIGEQIRRMQDLHRINPMAVLCGMCSKILPSAESLRTHLRDVHGLKTKMPTTYPLPPTMTVSASQHLNRAGDVSLDRRFSSGAPVDPYAQETRERKMDATYGLGGTARDYGRFGSAASHDGMDDESSP